MNSVSKRRLIDKFDRIETGARRGIGRTIMSIPFVWRFKAVKTLAVLEKLYGLLDRHGIEVYVVGGFAYDGLRGRLSRAHADIDFSIFAEDLPRALAHLSENGFRIQFCSPDKYRAWTPGAYGELFVWRPSGADTIEHLTEDVGVRMPRAFLREGRSVVLNGVAFKIPTIHYLRAALAFMVSDSEGSSVHEADRRLVMSQESEQERIPRIHREERQISYSVTMHDFCEADASR